MKNKLRRWAGLTVGAALLLGCACAIRPMPGYEQDPTLAQTVGGVPPVA